MAMMDDDPDDIFNSIVAGLEVDEDVSDVQDVTTLDDMALLHLWHELNEKLTTMKEQLQLTTSTPEGRAIHSQRVAVRVELTKRALL